MRFTVYTLAVLLAAIWSIHPTIAAEKKKKGKDEGPHIEEPVDPPVVNPARAVPKRRRYLTPAEAEAMQKDQDEAANQFLKQYDQDREEQKEQEKKREEGIKEHERALNSVVPEYLYAQVIKKFEKTIPRIEALQKRIADQKITLPERMPIDEMLGFQLKEIAGGDWGKKLKAFKDLSEEDRQKALKQEKAWLLMALAKIEIIERATLWSEKYVGRLLKLDNVTRLSVLQPTTPEAKEAWKQLVRDASRDTREILKKPDEDSLFSEKHHDILWAQPPRFDVKNPLEVVDELLYHHNVIVGATDKELEKSNPQLKKEDYEKVREGSAANYFFRFIWGNTGRKVEEIPK